MIKSIDKHFFSKSNVCTLDFLSIFEFVGISYRTETISSKDTQTAHTYYALTVHLDLDQFWSFKDSFIFVDSFI